MSGAMDLERDEVHCWYVDLDVPMEAEADCSAVLSSAERLRGARFRFDRDRRRFVVAHGVLRVLLGRYLGADPARLGFVDSGHGKPGLRPGSDGGLRFNLSHSGDLAAIAVARAEVGVDVERLRELEDPVGILRDRFPAPEVERLRWLPRRLRTLAFFRAWVAREAQVKARGLGLAEAPADLPSPPGRWSFHDLQPPPGHVGALVIRGGGWRLVERRWPAAGPAGAPQRSGSEAVPWAMSPW
jgi:4'-phosphopantetheinyl transferase